MSPLPPNSPVGDPTFLERAAATPSRRPLLVGALLAVLVGDLAQLAAGLAQVDPSPPTTVLPLLAATIALGVAAVPPLRADQISGYVLGMACCAVSFIGMGPHKLLTADGLVIAPMTLTGFAFGIVFVHGAITRLRSGS